MVLDSISELFVLRACPERFCVTGPGPVSQDWCIIAIRGQVRSTAVGAF